MSSGSKVRSFLFRFYIPLTLWFFLLAGAALNVFSSAGSSAPPSGQDFIRIFWFLLVSGFFLALLVAGKLFLEDVGHKPGGLMDKELSLALLDVLPDPFLVKDCELRWVYFNRVFCDFMGYSAGELAEKDERALLGSEQAEAWRIKDGQVLLTGQESVGEELLPEPGGGLRPVLIKRTLHKSASGQKFVVVLFRDLTGVRQAQERLQQAAAEWSRTFDSISDLILVTDGDSRILRCNKAACDAFGLGLDDLRGRRSCDLLHDGTQRHERCPFDQMRSDNRPHSVEMTALGNTPFVVTVAPIMENGRFTGAVHILKDISEQRANEDKLLKALEDLRNARDKLVRSEKLVAIGQLAAGVAHEINNPIGFIGSNLEVLREYVAAYTSVLDKSEQLAVLAQQGSKEEVSAFVDDLRAFQHSVGIEFIRGDVADLLSQSRNGVDRIKKIITDLRTFARDDVNQAQEPVKVESLVDHALALTRNSFLHRIEIVPDYGLTPRVVCNAQKLTQVFVNLLINAGQAIKDKGTIYIRTFVFEDNVHVEIRDTGNGISAEDLGRIFDPFFTTKPVGQGTGLGLSISLEIVKKQRGDILVSSLPGEGSTFTVVVPGDKV